MQVPKVYSLASVFTMWWSKLHVCSGLTYLFVICVLVISYVPHCISVIVLVGVAVSASICLPYLTTRMIATTGSSVCACVRAYVRVCMQCSVGYKWFLL